MVKGTTWNVESNGTRHPQLELVVVLNTDGIRGALACAVRAVLRTPCWMTCSGKVPLRFIKSYWAVPGMGMPFCAMACTDNNPPKMAKEKRCFMVLKVGVKKEFSVFLYAVRN
jgi:hypothetical protein